MASLDYVTDGMFRPDVVAELNGEPVLVGSECSQCGDIRFPRAQGCPRCHASAEALADKSLPREGTLVTATRIERGPIGFAVPYLVGYVSVGDGVRVLSQLTSLEDEPGAIIGRRCVLEVGALSSNHGEPVLGYRFAVQPS